MKRQRGHDSSSPHPPPPLPPSTANIQIDELSSNDLRHELPAETQSPSLDASTAPHPAALPISSPPAAPVATSGRLSSSSSPPVAPQPPAKANLLSKWESAHPLFRGEYCPAPPSGLDMKETLMTAALSHDEEWRGEKCDRSRDDEREEDLNEMDRKGRKLTAYPSVDLSRLIHAYACALVTDSPHCQGLLHTSSLLACGTCPFSDCLRCVSNRLSLMWVDPRVSDTPSISH